MTDADKQQVREMFDTIAPPVADDMRKRCAARAKEVGCTAAQVAAILAVALVDERRKGSAE